MATYVNDLRLKEIGTGESSGTWGSETNTNLELIAEAFSFGTEAITTNADTHTTTIADGSTDPGRSLYLKYTGTLDSACTITIGPNTVSKMWFIENATSGSQNIIIKQGSGATITIPPGDVKVVYSDGAGSGAAVVDAFASLSVVDLKVQDDLTVTDDLIVNGDIDLEGNMDVNGSLETDALSLNGTTVTSTAAELNILDGVTSTAAEINLLDGSSANTVVNSKAVIYGSSGQVAGTLSTAAQPNITSLGTLTTLTVDDITINGSTISDSGDLTVDVGGDIVLDAAGQQIFFTSSGTNVGQIDMAGTDLEIKSLVSDADLFIRGNDGGSEITALTLDMSDAGKATFNSDIVFGGTGPITSAANALKAANTGDNGFLIRSAVSSAANPSYSNVDDTNTGMFLPGSDVIGLTTGGTERMRIDSSGHVLLGTTSNQGVGGISFEKGGSGFTTHNNNNAASGGYEFYVFRRSSTQIGSIAQNGTTGIQLNTSSDARLKEVTGSARGLDVINNLNPVAYNWKADNRADEGLIAQEVEEFMPNAVSQTEDGYYMMDYSKLVTPLIKAVQEQQEQIESLKSEIENLKEK